MDGKLVNVRGKNLYVEVYGSEKNPPVLYLHGGPGESCFDFTYHQKNRLKDDLFVIAIDQRGVCRSEAIEEGEAFGLMDLVEDCEALRKYFNLEMWSLIGHSFGGYLSLLYAATYPDSIDRVIFECPTFDFELTSRFLLKKTAKVAKKYGQEELAERCLALTANPDKTIQQLTEEYMDLSDELGENRMEIYRYNNDNPTDYYSAYTDEEWEEFYDRSEIHYNILREEGKLFESLLPLLSKVKNPMMLMTSDHDAATCEKHIEAFEKDAENGTIYHFENCGHTPHYEDADHFKRIVVEYLKVKTVVK
ncbi:alpha/beta hydrolase [Pseudalkalibacillus caeni]|uniref:Alpha/beta hydrolase n=2 Tax=Exobacillus caeni TaxID=2574798 RepID=A0A5R9F2I7_9BACL|nr:alpha/beta hydrolase [Pseudalkalibacillus caeni]